MKILRLGCSEDASGDVPDDQRSYRIAERLMAEELGEPVETVALHWSPFPSFPDEIDRLIAQHEPDMVFLWVSAYWATYESVPLKLERKLGRRLRRPARLGLKLGRSQRALRSRAFRALRRVAYRLAGGAVAFEPEQIIRSTEACMRRVLSHEQVGLVVCTPFRALTEDARAAGKSRGEGRRQTIHRALRQLCAELHAGYLGCDEPFVDANGRPYVQKDRFHRSAEGHAIVSPMEAGAMLGVWSEMHGRPQPAVPPPARTLQVRFARQGLER